MKLVKMFCLCLVSVAFLAGCKPTGPDYVAQLTYVNWNLDTKEKNNLERRLIKAYEEKTNVKINIVENINTAAYEDAIAAMASKGNMPDVFMLTNMTFGLENQYLLDIKQYADEDDDWSKIPLPIEEATHYFDGIYSIPFAMHMMGYFVNEELLILQYRTFRCFTYYTEFKNTVALKQMMGLWD